MAVACTQVEEHGPKLIENWTRKDTVVTPTRPLAQLARHAERDSLLGSMKFWHQGVEHTVTAWTDEYYAPIDGGTYMLELDSLGVVYRHSTTWRGFTVVSTENDSLDRLIIIALGAALRPRPFGLVYRPPVDVPPIDLSTVDFSKLEIYDTTEVHP